jgi:single-strand DNA-binding protein
MASFNRVVLVGNLTRDPEYKQLPSGQAVCRLGLAVNRSFKSKQSGAAVQEVCYIDIDVWGAQAESCNQYLKKGRPVLVEGRLKFDTWSDQQGGTRSKHSIVADRVVFLQSGAASGAEASEASEDVADMTPARPSTISAPLEKEIMDQIEALKNRPKVAKTHAKKEATPEGAVEFKDEPPFQAELPF